MNPDADKDSSSSANKPWDSSIDGADMSDWFNFDFDEKEFVQYIN